VEFRDARRRAIPGVVARKLPVMITVMVDVEDMAVLRRLVGSVHYWHPELELIVYQAGSDLTLSASLSLTPSHA
jgi:short-subunit dehydrogenase involved in D-alanine esterification of teichoic acids